MSFRGIRAPLRGGPHLAIVGMAALGLAACAKYGYTNRVLHRVSSPDRAFVAVCQEIPEFDGPGYAVRLERPDGSLVRPLYENGDGRPCSEIAWSPDGKTLAVLSGHAAVLKFVDVELAMAHPSTETSHHSWRDVEANELIPRAPGEFVHARHLRFSDAETVEVELSPYRAGAAPSGHSMASAPERMTRQIPVPRPIFRQPAASFRDATVTGRVGREGKEWEGKEWGQVSTPLLNRSVRSQRGGDLTPYPGSSLTKVMALRRHVVQDESLEDRRMSKSRVVAIVLSLFIGLGSYAEETMKSVSMTTTIGEGSDQEVAKLYENAWTKLVQITLRNGKTLAGHSAKEPVTIQCVSGEGVLVIGEERVALKPGVVVPLEANVAHAVEAKPAVSVLVTRFLPAIASSEHRH